MRSSLSRGISLIVPVPLYKKKHINGTSTEPTSIRFLLRVVELQLSLADAPKHALFFGRLGQHTCSSRSQELESVF